MNIAKGVQAFTFGGGGCNHPLIPPPPRTFMNIANLWVTWSGRKVVIQGAAIPPNLAIILQTPVAVFLFIIKIKFYFIK